MRRQTQLVAVALVLLASVAAAQTKTIKAKPMGLVVLSPPKPSAVLVQEPLGLEYKTFLQQNGQQVIVFTMGLNKRVVLTAFSNGDPLPEVTQYVILVDGEVPPAPPGPAPGPTPEPDSPLTAAVSKFVRDEGRKAGVTKVAAVKVAGNYETIASKIAAVRSYTATEARDDLKELNRSSMRERKYQFPKAFAPAEKRINDYLEEVGQDDVRKIGKVLEDIAKGFRAI